MPAQGNGPAEKLQPSTGQGNQITQTHSDLPADTASQAHSLNSAFLAPTEAQALFMFLHHLYFSVPSHTDSSAGLELILHDCFLKRGRGEKKKREKLFLFLDYGTVSDDLGLIS